MARLFARPVRAETAPLTDYAGDSAVATLAHPRSGEAVSLDDFRDSEATFEPPGAPRIGELLMNRGVLASHQLDDALGTQQSTGLRLGEELIRRGFVGESAVTAALAEQFGTVVVDLSRRSPEAAVSGRLSEDVARRLNALALRDVDGVIEVVVGDMKPGLAAELESSLGEPVRVLAAEPTSVRQAIDRSYRALAEVDRMVSAFSAGDAGRRVESSTRDAMLTADSPVAKVVTMLVTQALRDRASDIHLEPSSDHMRVRMRIDGALNDILNLPSTMAAPVVSRIKILAGMNIVERRKAQDGQFATAVDGRDIDVRVSTMATVWGEKCVMRILDKSRSLIRLDELGMPDDTHREFSKMAHSPFGMVLCAGPTGSGKTTTLYATMSEIDERSRNIVTIEDPVEYVFPSINQVQTNDQAGITFADGLRAILRQDPDVILVGEIRDQETARIAVQAALTGHFVMSSLHATDSIAALHRFLDMGIEAFLLSSSVLGVVSQRLVRRTCRSCAEAYTPTDEELAFYEEYGGPEKHTFYRGTGCNVCSHTGYQDRIGVYEFLQMTPEIRRLLVGWATQDELRRVAVSQGMRTLRTEGLALVADDVTTISEIIRSIYALEREKESGMPKFQFSAAGIDGALVTGVESSKAISSLRESLLSRNLQPISISKKKSILEFEITKRKVSKRELMHLSRQLAVFIRSGVSVIEALGVLAEETTDKLMRSALEGMRVSLESGSLFSSAAAEHPELFPTYSVEILRSAELTGNLDQVLDQLGDYLEREVETEHKVKAAMVYPAIVLLMSIVVSTVLVVFVLPRFKSFFTSLHAKLPLPTRMLMALADWLGHWGLVAGGCFVAAVIAAMALSRTPKGRSTKDALMLRIPVIGSLVHTAIVERFCRLLASMTVAGVALPEALAVTTASTNNSVFQTRLTEARAAMLRGEGLATPLAQTGLFPGAARQMFAVGESTGNLDEQLDAAAKYLDRELDYKIKRFTTIIEPAVIVLVGVIVGFVAIALVSAMYGIFNQVKVT